MYKLLIIDDEPLVLAGIRAMIRWEELHIEICGAASNGSQGWDIMRTEKPDIVLTDIKMPVMSGLELLKKTRDHYHDNTYPVFILLTSYEDFHMAKEAISYHAAEYLVKLELNADTLKQCMAKVVKSLDGRQRPTDSEPADMSLKELQSLKDKFFIRLLHNLYDSEQQFETLRHDLNIPFDFPFCQCCYFEMNNADGDSMDIEQQVALYTASYQLIQEIVSKYAPAYYVNLDRKHGVIIFLLGDMPSGSPDLMQILKQTGHSLYNYYKTRLKCGIGTRVRAALSLSDSYQAARISFSNIVESCDTVLICDTCVINSKSHNVFNISIFREDLNKAFSEYNSTLLTNVLMQIIMMRKFGLNDKLLAIICLQAFSAFGVFMMKQFYEGIPDELCEAARIDGMSEYRIYASIMLPLSKPSLATLTIRPPADFRLSPVVKNAILCRVRNLVAAALRNLLFFFENLMIDLAHPGFIHIYNHAPFSTCKFGLSGTNLFSSILQPIFPTPAV